MIGILYSMLAGIFTSLQSVFNTRASEKIGLWETTTIVHMSGLILSLIIMVLFGNGSLKKITEVNGIYLLGGVFGVIAVYSVMRGISLLGVTFSVSLVLITQLIVSAIVDIFGLFGNPQIKIDFTKPLGALLMIVGIIIFKFKG